MANKRQKHPDLLRNPRGGQKPVLAQYGPPPEVVPAPPTGLLKCSRDIWQQFWESPAAGQVNYQVHGAALQDWIRHRDEWERTYKIFRRSMLVRGAAGQIRVNPLANRLQALRYTIEKYEQKFGLTPLDALRLGFDPIPRKVEDVPDPYVFEDDGSPDPRLLLRAVQ